FAAGAGLGPAGGQARLRTSNEKKGARGGNMVSPRYTNSCIPLASKGSMGTRAAGLAAVLALAAMLLSGSASAKPPWSTDLALINKGIDRAVAANRINSTEAAEVRSDANAAANVLPKLPSSRYRNLAAVVHQVAGFWKGYDSPRGLTLFGMLAFNTRWFASHWDQKAGKDVFDTTDGIWYRAFPGI